MVDEFDSSGCWRYVVTTVCSIGEEAWLGAWDIVAVAEWDKTQIGEKQCKGCLPEKVCKRM